MTQDKEQQREGRSLGRPEALQAARGLAGEQEGVLGRRQLAGLGVPRWVVRVELRAQRWCQTGRQTVCLHNGPLSAAATRWVAVLEVGAGAALDGVSSLQHAGVDALCDSEVHVIVRKGSTPQRPPGVVVHESRRYREADVLTNGLRRTRPAVAAVHAALWASTDRQARFFVLLVVQRQLAPVDAVATVVGAVRRHARRRLLRELVVELGAGIRSLGELDVAQDMRGRGLPEPARQVLRRRPSGTEYLDCDFDEYGVTMEIDGAGHDEPEQRLSDLVRDISSATKGRTVVRLAMVAYSLDRERVLDALEELFASRGWRRDDAA